MFHFRKPILVVGALLAGALFVSAQGPATNSTSRSGAGPGTNAVRAAAVKQGDIASKTATFGKIAKTDDAYKTALDAHALADALKLANKVGAFTGKVSMIFEPRNGTMAMLNFDANYRTALTALLQKQNFTNFPALTNLVGKDVLISGKFIDYQGRPEIILTNIAQVKLVQ